jgi:hypothetical protein
MAQRCASHFPGKSAYLQRKYTIRNQQVTGSNPVVGSIPTPRFS